MASFQLVGNGYLCGVMEGELIGPGVVEDLGIPPQRGVCGGEFWWNLFIPI